MSTDAVRVISHAYLRTVGFKVVDCDPPLKDEKDHSPLRGVAQGALTVPQLLWGPRAMTTYLGTA